MQRKIFLPFLLVLYIFCATPGCQSQSTTIHQVSNCTKSQLTLMCPSLTLTQVKDIVYGQASQCAFDPGRCYILDRNFHTCTGKQNCRIRVPTVAIPKCGYSSYMTLTYQCIPVSFIQNICATQESHTTTEGYLATPGYPNSLALPTTLKCTTSISQPRGWFVKIYLLDYAKVRVKVTNQGCESQVTFGEKTPLRLSQHQGQLPQVSLCLDSDLDRNQLLYKSLTSSVDVTFKGPVRIGRGESDKAGILLYYKAFNPEVPTPSSTSSTTQVVTMATTMPKNPVPEQVPQSSLATTSVRPAMNFFFKPIPDVPQDGLMPSKEQEPFIASEWSNINTTVIGSTNKPKSWLPGLFFTNGSVVDSFYDNNIHHLGNDLDNKSGTFGNLQPNNQANRSLIITEEGEGGTNKWASIMGGVMFGLAMVLLATIIVILYTDRRRMRKRQESTDQNAKAPLENGNTPSDTTQNSDQTEENTRPQENGINHGYHQDPLDDDTMIPNGVKMDREIHTIDMDETQTIICDEKYFASPVPARRNKISPSKGSSQADAKSKPMEKDEKNKFETTVTIHNGDVTIYGSMEYLPPITDQTRSKFRNQLEGSAIYEEPCVAVLPSSECDTDNKQCIPTPQCRLMNISSCSSPRMSISDSIVYEAVEKDRNGRLSSPKGAVRVTSQYVGVQRPSEPPPPKPKTQKPPLKPKPRLSSSKTSLTQSSNSINKIDLDANGYVDCRGSRISTSRNSCHSNHCYSNHSLPKVGNEVTIIDNELYEGTIVVHRKS